MLNFSDQVPFEENGIYLYVDKHKPIIAPVTELGTTLIEENF